MPTNDNDLSAGGALDTSADPHGQAALLLVESLMHCLMERSILTRNDAMEVLSTTLEVQADVAEAADGEGTKMWRSHSLLLAISHSLQQDLRGVAGWPDSQRVVSAR